MPKSVGQGDVAKAMWPRWCVHGEAARARHPWQCGEGGGARAVSVRSPEANTAVRPSRPEERGGASAAQGGGAMRDAKHGNAAWGTYVSTTLKDMPRKVIDRLIAGAVVHSRDDASTSFQSVGGMLH